MLATYTTDHGAVMSVPYRWGSALWPIAIGAGVFIFGVCVLKTDVLGVSFKNLDLEDVFYSFFCVVLGLAAMALGWASCMARLQSQLAKGLALVVDDRGLHHYILGTVPWGEIKELTYLEAKEGEDNSSNAGVRIVLSALAFRRLDPHLRGFSNLFIRLQLGYSQSKQELSLTYRAPHCDPYALWQRMSREVKF